MERTVRICNLKEKLIAVSEPESYWHLKLSGIPAGLEVPLNLKLSQRSERHSSALVNSFLDLSHRLHECNAQHTLREAADQCSAVGQMLSKISEDFRNRSLVASERREEMKACRE